MLHAESTGSGIPLVFLHAFPLSRRMWEPNKATLSKHFRLITIDLPGFGDSSPVAGDTASMDVMARGVLDALDGLKLSEKFVAAGLSMGGYVLFHLLQLAPDRIRAAAFLSTRAGADSAEGRDKRFKNIELVQKGDVDGFTERMVPALLGKTSIASNPALLAEVRGWIRAARPEGVCAALRGMAARPDMSATLESIDVPALFLAGEEDGVIPPSEMESNAKRVGRAEFKVIPGAGHLTNLEKPTPFHDAFLHFLKSKVL